MRNKTMKLFVACLLSLVMILSSGITPVSATSTATGVDILFFVPDDWSTHYYGPKIHLWNAGSYTTTWPGTEMIYVRKGVYRYTNFNLNSCNFVINDGYGNSQTGNLYANGKVTVKDGNVVNRSQHPTQIRFERPYGWGDNINIYYYSADSSETEIYSWPGTKMEKENVFHYWGKTVYNYEITELENCRVVFSDGVNQYPARNQPGILVNAGNTYYISDSNVSSQDYYSTTITPSANQVHVGQEFKIILDTVNYYSQYITDNGDGMEIVNEEVLSRGDGRIVIEYTVKFTTGGSKMVHAYMSHNSSSYQGKSVEIRVHDPNDYENSSRWDGLVTSIDNLSPTVNLGEPINVNLVYGGDKTQFVWVTEDGEVINNSRIINRRCKNMKVFIYTYHPYSPYSRFYSGYFTITVK